MKTLLHFINDIRTTAEYESASDLLSSYRKFGVDGLEIIRSGVDSPLVLPEMVIGYHLPFYANWMDFWMGNTEGLTREFGAASVWESFYHGKDKQALVSLYQNEMDYADKIGAEYAVFHVSNVTTREGFSHQFSYTDEQVADAAAELINQAFGGRKYGVYLFLENLFWPGLTYQNPRIAARLLERINYHKTALLLDTGHLMCTNPSLKNQSEACAYIHQTLDGLGSLAKEIRGVHLHQSITGEYVRWASRNQPVLASDFWERFEQAYQHILRIDSHKPMTDPGTPALIRRIEPQYVTYEFTSSGRREREALLKQQAEVFGLSV